MNDKIDTMTNDYVFVSYNFNWLNMSWRILIKLYLILTHMGGGASLYNWSKQSACTAVASEVDTIFLILSIYFSPVVTHSPRKICSQPSSAELNPRLFWLWPSKKDLMVTHQAAVLPL